MILIGDDTIYDPFIFGNDQTVPAQFIKNQDYIIVRQQLARDQKLDDLDPPEVALTDQFVNEVIEEILSTKKELNKDEKSLFQFPDPSHSDGSIPFSRSQPGQSYLSDPVGNFDKGVKEEQLIGQNQYFSIDKNANETQFDSEAHEK